MKTLFSALTLFFFFNQFSFAQNKVRFIVQEKLPQKNDSIYISGTFNNWNTGAKKYKLQPVDSSHQLIILNLPAGKCEYKFTRGNWLLVEKDDACQEIENRRAEIHADTTINIIIPKWNDECSQENLQKLLQTQSEDSNKVNTLNILSYLIVEFKPSLQYAEEALSLDEKINFKTGEGTAYRNIGECYLSQNNYAEAHKYFPDALKIQESLKDKSEIARTYLNIANSCLGEGDYPEAIKNSYSVLKLYEEAGNKEGMSYAYSYIGNYYSAQGDDSEALKNYLIYLKLSEEIGEGSRELIDRMSDIVWSLNLGNENFE